MGRAPCCEKVGLKKGRWTAEEDETLVNYIQANGEGSWRSLPKNAGLLRCGKSCRLRWINYLRADLKRGNISTEEDETIVKLHDALGNRWSLIATHLPGRTDNEIKNYWNSHLSRRIHSFRRRNGDGAPVIMDFGRVVGGRRWRQASRTNRSPMKNTSSSSTTTTITVHGPITGDRHSNGSDGLPTSHCMRGGGGGTTSMKASPTTIVTSADAELFDLEQFLPSDFWETNEEMGDELLCQSGEGEVGTGEEREPPVVEVVEGAETPGGSMDKPPEAERGESSIVETMDRWAAMELEEMAAQLWEEAAGEEWRWQWDVAGDGGQLGFPQYSREVCSYEEEEAVVGAWLLSDIL